MSKTARFCGQIRHIRPALSLRYPAVTRSQTNISIVEVHPMYRPSYHIPLLLALAAAVAFAGALGITGCGKDSPTQPSATSQQDSDDAAQQVAFMMATDNGTSPEVTVATGQSSLMSSPVASTGLTSTDTTFTLGHITWTITRSFFNALGVEQATFNPITTVRMDVTTRGSGTIETPSDTASYGSAGSLSLLGLAASQDSLIMNGTRHDTLQTSLVPRFRTGRIFTYAEASGIITNVVTLKPLTATSYPLSGTATWTLKLDRLADRNRVNVSRHVDILVEVKFNGTANPDVTTSSGYRYKMNLKTGLLVRA
jgi:hypothetical protein